jgi:hypothetical protein
MIAFVRPGTAGRDIPSVSARRLACVALFAPPPQKD